MDHFATGQLLDGRYRIEHELGRGGMGAVYRAHDLQREQPAAIKALLEIDLELLDRFEREAQIMARIDAAAGVVRVLSVGRDPLPYIAMELVEGEDLEQRMERGVEPLELARLLAEVGRTLAACHAAGVLHRDLKPANVLLDAGGRTRLVDFGIARDLARERLTRTGELLGTPGYMAPEQADDAKSVDERCDVYALGAILYHGLTGRPPFQGDSLLSVLSDLLNKEPERPSSLTEDVPRDLEAVCLKALAKSPDDRYPSAEALAEDLERAAAGRPVRARPIGPLTRLWRRVGVPGLIAGALLIAAGLALSIRWVAQRSVAEHEAWAEARLEPFAYGLTDAEAGFSADDLQREAARLERVRWLVGGEARVRLEASLARLSAHRALLDHLAGAQVDPPKTAGAPAQVVAARILADRGQTDAARRRLNQVADDGGPAELRARALLELRLLAALSDPARRLERLRAALARHADDPTLRTAAARALVRAARASYLDAVRRAPELPQVLETLRSLHELIAPHRPDLRALLAEEKRAALEASAPTWERALRASARNPLLTLLPLLRRLTGVVHAPPDVPPGARLRGLGDVAQAVADAAQARAGTSTLQAQRDLLQLRIDVSQHLFYELDATRRVSSSLRSQLRDLLHTVKPPVSPELPLILLRSADPKLPISPARRMLAMVARAKLPLPAHRRSVLPVFEALARRRPRSRALAYARAVLGYDGNLHQLKVQGDDAAKAIRATGALIALAQAAAEPGGERLDDLGPAFRASAFQVVAALCARRRRLDPDPAFAKRTIAAARRARALKIDYEYLSDTFSDEADAAQALGGPRAQAEVWRAAVQAYQGRKGTISEFRIHRDLAKSYRRLAGCHRALEELELGIAAARKAVAAGVKAHELSRISERVDARAMLASLLIEARRADEAEAVLRPDVEQGLHSKAFVRVYVSAAIARGDLAEAERRWRVVIAADPTHARELRRYRKSLERLRARSE